MKFYRIQGHPSCIKGVRDVSGKLLGLVGTVGSLLSEGILTECDAPHETWMCIPVENPETGAGFGETRLEAVWKSSIGGEDLQ